ncbi:TRADD-N-associated membrane domain-containing protein [Actinoplanes sp. CA-131856]
MPDTEERPAPWLMSNADLARVIHDDKRLARGTAGVLACVFLAAAAGLTIATVQLEHRASGVPLASVLIVAAFLLLASVAVPMIVLGLHRARRRRWERRERECRELAHIAKSIRDPALGELITFNFRLMDRFVAVAITQSRTSYLACLGAATAGLLVLLVGATTALSVDGLAGQITAGVLTAVGAGLSSFLSVIFLRPFQMTSKQMSYYYGQPLVHCYLLHAEWLAERYDEQGRPANRGQLQHELIRAALDAARNAQDHLLDLQLGVGDAGGAAPQIPKAKARRNGNNRISDPEWVSTPGERWAGRR